jgi:hypothetical protein
VFVIFDKVCYNLETRYSPGLILKGLLKGISLLFGYAAVVDVLLVPLDLCLTVNRTFLDFHVDLMS